MKFFSGFRAKLQKRVTSVAFQSILRKRIRKLPKFPKFLKILQFCSILFNRVLNGALVALVEVVRRLVEGRLRRGEEAQVPGVGVLDHRGARRRDGLEEIAWEPRPFCFLKN